MRNQDQWNTIGMKSRRQLTLGSVTRLETLYIKSDGKGACQVMTNGFMHMRLMMISNFVFGKKKIGNQPSKEEGAIQVVQDLEREAKHSQKSKEKERR